MKRLTIFLITMLMLISLCSCTSLNELKDKYAFFFENENGVECISYKGNTFIKVDNTIPFDSVQTGEITVTKSAIDMKVPFLLSEKYGDTYTISKEGLIIRSEDFEGMPKPIEKYVREDYYDTFCNAVKNGFDAYCITETTEKNTRKFTKLSDEIQDAIDTVFAAEPIETADRSHEHIAQIWRCTDDEYIRTYRSYATVYYIYPLESYGFIKTAEWSENSKPFYVIPKNLEKSILREVVSQDFSQQFS